MPIPARAMGGGGAKCSASEGDGVSWVLIEGDQKLRGWVRGHS